MPCHSGFQPALGRPRKDRGLRCLGSSRAIHDEGENSADQSRPEPAMYWPVMTRFIS